jgi:hypothetical protein
MTQSVQDCLGDANWNLDQAAKDAIRNDGVQRRWIGELKALRRLMAKSGRDPDGVRVLGELIEQCPLASWDAFRLNELRAVKNPIMAAFDALKADGAPRRRRP